MKRIFTIILLFAPLLCFAQTYAEMQEAKEAEVFEEDRKRQQRYEAYMEELNENARRQRERLEQFQVNFLQEEEQRARDKARREAELQAQRERAQQEAQLRAKQQREAQLRAQQQAQQQAERKRQIAAYNQQVAARNAQIRAHNEQLREEQAEQRREAARQRAEAERRRKEALKQQVTQDTYNQLEQQTLSMEHAAADAAGAGADRLARNHPVSRYETDIPVGGGRPTSQIDHLPRQKFEIPTGPRILDPDKVYYCNMPQNEGDVYLFYQDASSPVPPSVDNSAPWLDFCDNMPSKRAAAHLALMRQACGGDMPATISDMGDYTAFMSRDSNTVIAVTKDGDAMFVWHLDDGEHEELKTEIYGKLNSVKVKHSEEHTNIEHQFDTWNESKKEKPNEKSGVDLAFGIEKSLDGLASVKGTMIYFPNGSQRHAVVGSVEGFAGYKVKADIEANANIKKEPKISASVGNESLKVELQLGYMYMGEKNIHMYTAGSSASIGYGVGIEISKNSIKASKGVFTLGMSYDHTVFPISISQ